MPARKAASLAVFGLLLCGSLASAQTTLGKPVAAPVGSTYPFPTISMGESSNPGTSQQVPGAFPADPSSSSLQRTQYKGSGAEDISDFEFDLEVPPRERVFGRLESESSLQQRIIALNRDKGKPKPIFPEYPPVTNEKYFGRQWPQLVELAVPNYVNYNRLYFEQKNFERYGWDFGVLAPVVETLIFGGDVAMLPYNMFTDAFRRYECSAGYCLPGDPVPFLLYPPELSVTGATAELATIFALIAFFP
jgi:hypothetical protein